MSALTILLIALICQTKTVSTTPNWPEALALVPSEKEEAEVRAEKHIVGKSREAAFDTRKEYTVSNEPCGTRLRPLSRIEFGKEVNGAHEWPFMAHVSVICTVNGQPRIIQSCGGTIVQKRWILTAGHCTHVNFTSYEKYGCDQWKQPVFEEIKAREFGEEFVNMTFYEKFESDEWKQPFFEEFKNEFKKRMGFYIKVKADEMQVTVGNKDYTLGTKHQVVRIKRHESFRSNEMKNDLALLELTHPLEFGPDVSRVCLGKAEPVGIESATIIGWGLTKGDLLRKRPQHLPDSLRQDNVRLSPVGCPKHAVCQFSLFHKTTRGDSGGPLLRTLNGRWTQIGVIWGHETEHSNKNFFNKIASFCEWIHRSSRTEVSCK